MGGDLVLIYDLHADAERIRHVQEASLNRPGAGFPTTPFLFGSAEWWSAIGAGLIERRSVEGVISAVYWGSMVDWPEFRMRTADGSNPSRTRFGDLTRYVEGLHVRVEFVTLDCKPDAPLPELGTTAEVVIAVWIEQSNERTPYYKGYRGSSEPNPEMVHRVHSFSPRSEYAEPRRSDDR